MAGLVVSAAILGGELVLGLDSGEIIKAGIVQGTRGLRGQPGPPGAKGTPGRDGNTILHGPGAPRADVGRDGDCYIDTMDLRWFGPKVAGSWPPAVDLLAAGKAERRSGNAERSNPWSKRGQFFGAAGSSGPTGGSISSGSPGWLPINLNNTSVPANTPVTISTRVGSDALKTVVMAEAAGGAVMTELNSFTYAGDTNHTEAWMQTVGSTPPVLTFTTRVVNGTLELVMESDVTLSRIRGKFEAM